MNRTVGFLSLAGGLALLAIVLAVPRPAPAAPAQGGGAGGGTVTPVSPAPPPDPVRPAPPPQSVEGSLKMNGRLSHPVIAAGTSDLFMTVDLSGVEVPGAERAAVNLAVVIDRSGSMAGEPLEKAKQAALHLVDQLRASDRLSIVHYGSDVKYLPGAMATAENKERMRRYIRRITDDGGTNIGDGLQSGRAQVLQQLAEFKVNRLILISDGQPTEGVTEPRALMSISRRIRSAGVTVSSIGVGTEFDEDLMQGIAEYGAGSYGYLRDAAKLAAVFQKDLQQAGTTVARDVELSFELPEGTELGEVLGYRHTRAGRTVRIAMTDFSAGQVERVVVRLRVTGESVGQPVDVARLQLGYTDMLQSRPVTANAQLAAMVTDRLEEIAQKQDKDAVVFAARARAAQNLTLAADSLERGDRKKAEELLDQNREIFTEAAAVAGAAPVAADLAAQEEMATGMMSARDEAEVQHRVKASKAKALQDFGRMGSAYAE